MTNDNKISFFCNVLTQAPHLDLAQVVAELDKFGLSPKQVTIGDILGAKYRVEVFRAETAPKVKKVWFEKGWFETDDSFPMKRELDDDEVANADRRRLKTRPAAPELSDLQLQKMQKRRKPLLPNGRSRDRHGESAMGIVLPRQSDPLTDENADAIVLKALIKAGGINNWVLAERIRAFGSNSTLRRDSLARMCARGDVERTGRNRGTKYRVKGVRDTVIVRKGKKSKTISVTSTAIRDRSDELPIDHPLRMKASAPA